MHSPTLRENQMMKFDLNPSKPNYWLNSLAYNDGLISLRLESI